MVIDLPKAAVCVPILPKINRKETQNNLYIGYGGAWIRLKKMQFPGGVPLRLSIGEDCNAAIIFPAASQTLRDLSNTQKSWFKLQFLSFIKEMINFNK